MDGKERAEPSLPLPVQDIVKHMRKPVDLNKPRPRRFSDVHPAQSQRHPLFSLETRSVLTPTAHRSDQAFFPPSSSTTFSKKPTSSRKVDMYVPSPGQNSHFISSSSMSMYDKVKSQSGTYCGSSSRFSNTSVDSAVSDEVSGLDDNLEDGSLATLLTPDMINTLRQSTTLSAQSDFLWPGKAGHALTELTSSCQLSPATDMNQFENFDQDISFPSEFLNLDQSSHKLTSSSSNFDLFCGDLNDFSNESGFSGGTANSPAPSLVQAATEKTRSFEPLTLLNMSEKNQTNNTRSSLIQATTSTRISHPQVGVAAVIKAGHEEDHPVVLAEKLDNRLLAHRPHNVESIRSLLDMKVELKSEISSPSTESESRGPGCVLLGGAELTKVVPAPTKRGHDGLVKAEPKLDRGCTSREEESTEDKWKVIESFIYSPDNNNTSPRKRKRCDSGSSGHMSNDDDDDDDDDGLSSYEEKDEDSDDDYSDIDPDLVNIRPSECESLVALGKKQKQFFWQYNVQSKGPKGTKLKLAVGSPSDPHVLNEFEDPVFDECNTAIAGIRHGGKARKGDGNEISPNPRKLFMIGHQLLRLNAQINACQLGMDVPLAKRNESRKEKNKLASRACRLKKKAQHEANKIKLYGLEQEHSQLNSVLQFIWPHIRERVKVCLGLADKSISSSSMSSSSSSHSTLTSLLESQINLHLKNMIAGHTVEYVNKVILKVEAGDNNGGLNIKKSHRT